MRLVGLTGCVFLESITDATREQRRAPFTLRASFFSVSGSGGPRSKHSDVSHCIERHTARGCLGRWLCLGTLIPFTFFVPSDIDVLADLMKATAQQTKWIREALCSTREQSVSNWSANGCNRCCRRVADGQKRRSWGKQLHLARRIQN